MTTLTFDQIEFSSALKLCSEVCDLKAPLPILHDVLVTQDRMQVTDLTCYLTAHCYGEGSGEVLLPLKPLSVLTAPEVRRGGTGCKVSLAGGSILAPGLDATLEAGDPKEFPSWPEPPDADNFKGAFNGTSADFADALKWVLKAASRDLGRPHLTHVEFRGANITATDGHRVHRASLAGSGAESLDVSVLIPLRPALVLAKLLPFGDGDFIWETTEGPWAHVSSSPWTLVFKPGDIRFPPVDKVIPDAKSANAVVKVDAAMLGKALKRLAKISDSDEPGVLLELAEDTLLLSPYGSKVVLRVPAGITGQTAACKSHNITGTTYPERPAGSPVAVNHNYLGDALPSEGEVELRLWAPYEKVLVSYDERIAVISLMGY